MPQRLNIILDLPARHEGPFCRAGVLRLVELTQEMVFSCDAISEVGHTQASQVEVFLIALKKSFVLRSFYVGDRQDRQACQVKRTPGRVAARCRLSIVFNHRVNGSSRVKA